MMITYVHEQFFIIFINFYIYIYYKELGIAQWAVSPIQ